MNKNLTPKQDTIQDNSIEESKSSAFRANRKNILKALLFVAIFCLILYGICFVINRNTDTPRSCAPMTEFYDQPANSLDVVLLGASNVYAFYQPAWAWEQYGITSWCYTNSGRPFELALHTLKETRKTQPDALYVIPVDTFSQKADSAHIHFLTDYLPFSQNKLDTINFYCDMADAEGTNPVNTDNEPGTVRYFIDNRLEYVFPLIRYHSRWKELLTEDGWKDLFSLKKKMGLKSSSYYGKLFTTEDVSAVKYSTTQRKDITPELAANIDELLDYCDKEKVKILFISMPKCSGGKNEDKAQMCNTIGDIVRSRGYDYVNYIDYIDEIGLNPQTDYYNWKHTNIYGTEKFTPYFANYLQQTYGIADKRSKSGYDDWNAAAKKYNKLVDNKKRSIEK